MMVGIVIYIYIYIYIFIYLLILFINFIHLFQLKLASLRSRRHPSYLPSDKSISYSTPSHTSSSSIVHSLSEPSFSSVTSHPSLYLPETMTSRDRTVEFSSIIQSLQSNVCNQLKYNKNRNFHL